MSEADYDPGGWYGDDPGPETLAEWQARADQAQQARERRQAGGWTYRDRPPVKRTLTPDEAMRTLAERKDTAPTPEMRRIVTNEEQLAYMDEEPKRALDQVARWADSPEGRWATSFHAERR